MRTIVWTILASGMMLAIAPAHAQTYDPRFPICVQLTEWGGTHIDCSFTSLSQCQASASNRGTCFTNPYFQVGTGRPQSRMYR